MSEVEILSKQIQKDLDSGKAKSQAQIARGIGVEPQEITNWKARGKIPAEKQKLVCKYYNWSLDYLNTAQDHNKETDHPTPVNAPQGIHNPTDAQLASLISVATPTYMKDLENIQKAQDAGVLEKSDKALLKIIAEKYKDRL